MSNANKPQGLAPVKSLTGATWNGQANVYYIPTSDSTNAYAIGDPVATLSGGADANGVSAVVLATAGSTHPIRGVIIGIGTSETLVADPNNLSLTTIPATKLYPYYVVVVDDPHVIFEVQEFSGSGSTNFTAADIGKNVNLKAGTNNGFISGWTLDDTAATAADATRQTQLLGIRRTADNAFGSYCKFYVRINLHEFNAAVVGT
jgi:hypothetical protein